MSRRIPVILLLGVLVVTVACTNKKVNNPLANVGSKQPDKVLFDRAMEALKHNRFDVARITLQTLINTYPDSEYIARAKLGVADSWYAEGGTTALAQAEIEYKDFITFFPNMPEAAEAQLKIANIHYQEMEKPDRDFTHAARAEEEYRTLIMQWPDSKLLPEAKLRLMEVQEVLGEREFRVGRFYYLRQSFPAAEARLQSLVDKYPLYSQADEALFLLGQSYEGSAARIRASSIRQETTKAKLIAEDNNKAAEAYSRILTRYPLMERAAEAKDRLLAMHRPVPRPTKEMLAQNRKEIDSRKESGMVSHLMANFNKHPDVAQATRVGEPTLVDPTPVSPTDIIQQVTRTMQAGAAGGGNNSVAVETVNGAPPPNQPAPRSDTPTETAAPPADTQASPAGVQPAASELTPNVPADPNELKPNVQDDTQGLPPPQQVNEIGASSSSTADGKTAEAAAANPDDDTPTGTSSSKKKKKKGLRKLVPF
jgi:outer membrane protein assembly factor BamD